MARRGTSGAERRAWNRVLGLAFVLLVGASAGLVAFRGGATTVEVVGVAATGILFGGVLLWYLASLRTPGRDRGPR